MREISLTGCAPWSPSPTWAPSPTPRAPAPGAAHHQPARGRPGGAGRRGAAHAHARAGAPTAIGETLLARARRLLADASQALDDVQRQVQGLEGRVRLARPPGPSPTCCRRRWNAGARPPRIDVQVAVLTSQETLLRLADGTLDVGLVALPQPPTDGLVLRPWRRDPVLAFLPASWQAPARLTPAWLAERPLILNDASTRLSRLTAEWFAAAGLNPRARIQLNYNDAIKSLVAAGYSATLLPHEATAPQPDPRIAMRPLRPALWRPLGIAHRAGDIELATRHVLDVLWALRAATIPA